MDMGGWKTRAMFKRYAIDSSADQKAAAEKIERAREEKLKVHSQFTHSLEINEDVENIEKTATSANSELPWVRSAYMCATLRSSTHASMKSGI